MSKEWKLGDISGPHQCGWGVNPVGGIQYMVYGSGGWVPFLGPIAEQALVKHRAEKYAAEKYGSAGPTMNVLGKESTMEKRSELSFDGCGINGPDAYRTRIATFNRILMADEKCLKRYGHLFEAAPELAEAVRQLLEAYAPLADQTAAASGEDSLHSSVAYARAALRKSKGEK